MVVSIGNLTLGGTGKTPMTIYLARLLARLGYRPAVISRGYKGKSEKYGGLVSDGRHILMGPDQAGDEPLMMAHSLENIPVAVGRDRFEIGSRLVERYRPDVVLLDDGFQHLKLFRDLDLILLDSTRPFGNHRLFPRGVLREPISAAGRADALILTRSDQITNGMKRHIQKRFQGLPVFQSVHSPSIRALVGTCHDGPSDRTRVKGLTCFQGKKVYLFSGIANNRDFFQSVIQCGCHFIGISEFPDHHRYSDRDLDNILQTASDRSADVILTTEKDYIRIDPRRKWPILLAVIGIDICFENSVFDRFIETSLGGMHKFKWSSPPMPV